MPFTEDIEYVQSLQGKRIRWTQTGEADTHRVTTQTWGHIPRSVKAQFSIVIEGEVAGWRFETGRGGDVNVAGYGWVPLESHRLSSDSRIMIEVLD